MKRIDWNLTVVTVLLVIIVFLVSILLFPQWRQFPDLIVLLGADIVAVLSIVGVYDRFVRPKHPNAPNAQTTAQPITRHAKGAPKDFVGRKEEIEALVKLLESKAKDRYAEIYGLGGVGKTALALRVIKQVAKKYPDGQILIDMQGTGAAPLAPTDVMGIVIRALTPLKEKLPDNVSEIESLYRSSLVDKRALLLFDNARDAAQVRPLLEVPSCGVLITSRRQFDLPGLLRIQLGVLSPLEAQAFLKGRCSRIETHAQEIAELCGCLPLALEIAAGFLTERADYPITQYVTNLHTRRLNTLKKPDDPDYDVEAAFAETYDHLSAEMQARWRMLGVFPAPFTTDAAFYIWQMDDKGAAQDLLSELVRYSLVEFRDGRYGLHDLLRDFARGRLTDDERWTAEKRHAEFYLAVARAADQLYLHGGEDVLNGLNLFDQELTQIRAGQAWAAANAENDEYAAQLCSSYPAAAVYVSNLRLSIREQIHWLEQALKAAKQLGDKRYESIHLGNLGIAFLNLGEVPKAIEYHQQALAIDRELGDKRGEGSHLGNLGNAYADLGEVPKAIEYYQQALAIARELGDRRTEANQLANMGLAYKQEGDKQKAKTLWEQALRIYQEIQDPNAKKVRTWLEDLDRKPSASESSETPAE